MFIHVNHLLLLSDLSTLVIINEVNFVGLHCTKEGSPLKNGNECDEQEANMNKIQTSH